MMKTRGSSSSRYRIRTLAIELRRECPICEAAQECDELVPFRLTQRETAERGLVACADLILIVLLRRGALTCLLIMSQHSLQRREASVVHVRCGQGNVSQRRHAQGP